MLCSGDDDSIPLFLNILIVSDVQALTAACKGYVPAEMVGCKIHETEIIRPANGEREIVLKARLNNHDYKVGWVIDADVSSCMSCSEIFGFLVGKHHCRSCGLIFCDGIYFLITIQLFYLNFL